MRRRDLIIGLAGATGLWPLRTNAQQSAKIPRIGVLLPGTPDSFASRTKAFLEVSRNLATSKEKQSRSNGNGDRTELRPCLNVPLSLCETMSSSL